MHLLLDREGVIEIMTKSHSEAYASAGVDITAGYKAVQLMKEHIAKTNIPGVLSDIGGFGGLFAPDLKNIEEPVFVSGTDGVGTKIRIAQLLDRHDTIGQDCVAMCVNDIVCSGARPLFFLDYIAIGKNDPEKVADIVKGVAEGCVLSGCALIGGETAEHPGVMKEDDYDLAGFSVGMVDRRNIIDKARVKSGDKVIALPSSGVHSNGFSLVRKVFDIENADLNAYEEELGESLGEALLRPTRIYVKAVNALAEQICIHGLSHITGGGFYENMPRCLDEGQSVKIDRSALKIPKIFGLIQKRGNISDHDMFNTFNMGVGMIVIVAPEDTEKALQILKEQGEDAYLAGEVVESGEGVILQ